MSTADIKSIVCFVTIILVPHTCAASLSSLARNDAFPVYNTKDPHSFLQERKKQQLKGYETVREEPERFGISVSPFGQNANFGKDIDGDRVELGDINGRWSMLALLFDDGSNGVNQHGTFPANKQLPQSLQTARELLFYPKNGKHPGLNNPYIIDPLQRFGFFTNMLKYRKKGLRFQVDVHAGGGFGASIQSGVADISNVLNGSCSDAIATYSCGYWDKGRLNLTCFAESTCGFRLQSHTDEQEPCCNNAYASFCKNCQIDGFDRITTYSVNELLMDKLTLIADELDLDISNFHEVAMEELRLNLFWRRAFEINKDQSAYPQFLFIPFFQASGSFSGKKINPNKLFGAPFGNNGHTALGFTGGVNFDFYDLIEIGAHAGTTYFFKETFCNYRVPNSRYQSGLYPFATDVSIKPGTNWQFGLKLSAYHFLDKLSAYAQYVMVSHSHDEICLLEPDPAFFPHVLEERSKWNTKVANIGFDYDIAPYVSLGVLWQAPLSQRNTFRSSTVMFSVNGTY